jgi:hypothetical protein
MNHETVYGAHDDMSPPSVIPRRFRELAKLLPELKVMKC